MTSLEPTLGPRAVEVHGFGDAGSVEASTATFTGYVGEQVIGMVLHTRAQGEVTATISQQRFAAWWPGPEWGVEAHPFDIGIDATLTYADGTAERIRLDGVGPGQRG